MGWAAARKLRTSLREPRPHPRGRADLRRARARPARAAAAGRRAARPRCGAVRARIDGPGADRRLAPDLAAAEELVATGARAGRGRGRGGGDGVKGSREVRAPRGTELSCKGWPQEAVLRMLMNNLDPDVAENPDDLVVYGGTGRAARSWEAFDAIVALAARPRGRRDAARAVGQAGRRHAHARVGAARADRQLQPRAGVGDVGRVPPPRGPRADDVRADDRGLVDLHRHARASCRAPTSASRRSRGASHGGSLAGTITLTAGLGGMGGAQPLAVTMNDGVVLCVEVDPHRIQRRLETRYLDEQADRPRRRGRALPRRRAPSGARSASACSATPPRCFRALLESRLRGRHRHRPDERARPARRLRPGPHDAGRRPSALRDRGPRRVRAPRARRDGRALRRDGRLPGRAAPRSSTTATRLRAEAKLGGFERAFDYPGFVPAYVRPLFCEGKGPFRWVALSGDPADIARDRPRRARGVPRRRAPRPLDPLGRPSGSPSRACPPASAGSATASARGSGCASTRWCASASCRRRS